MAFPSISQNYQGRRVDLAIFPDLRVSALPVSSGFGTVSRAVAGPAKAVQNYARVLLTPLGTNRARPLLGSNLLTRIQQGFVRYPADLASLFAIENLRVLNFLSTLSALSDDERVASVILGSYDATPGNITMNLTLSVASGDTLPFLLPVVWNS